jgi:hypothetical protein
MSHPVGYENMLSAAQRSAARGKHAADHNGIFKHAEPSNASLVITRHVR